MDSNTLTWDQQWNAILAGNNDLRAKDLPVTQIAQALPPDDGLAAQMVRLAEAGLAHDSVTAWAGEPEDALPTPADFADRSEAEVRYSLALHAAWRELEHWVMTTAQAMEAAADPLTERAAQLNLDALYELTHIPIPALNACRAYLTEQHKETAHDEYERTG